MSESILPAWKDLNKQEDLDEILKISHKKPVLLLRYRSDTDANLKRTLENEWVITEPYDVYTIDDDLNPQFPVDVCNQLDVDNIAPQMMLIVEGEVIYDEYENSISAKKIMLALRIINQTLKWLETRLQKKASG